MTTLNTQGNPLQEGGGLPTDFITVKVIEKLPAPDTAFDACCGICCPPCAVVMHQGCEKPLDVVLAYLLGCPFTLCCVRDIFVGLALLHDDPLPPHTPK